MTENNDKLLIDFFAENRQEIPDNGFTRRVMRHLPDRTRRISLFLLYRKICSLA